MTTMQRGTKWSRRAVLALALPCAGALAAASTPVAVSLVRPALPVRQAERSMLLAAALAGGRIVAVGERGVVVVSEDGGASWRQRPTPVSVTLTAVRFTDASNGIAVGHGGVVLLTADGGASWTVVLEGKRAAAIALEAARASRDAAAITNAERLVADGADKPFLDVLASDPAQLLVVGAYGLAFASADGGRSWTPWMDRLDNPKGLHYYAVRRRGDALLIAGEQGLLLRSTDGGRTFRRLESPYKGSFFVAELAGERDIVVAGLRGNAWRSSDDGRSWSRIQSPANASITASLQSHDGGLFFGDQAGNVLRLVEDRLKPVNATALPPINGLVAAGQRVTALTMLGALPLNTSAH